VLKLTAASPRRGSAGGQRLDHAARRGKSRRPGALGLLGDLFPEPEIISPPQAAGRRPLSAAMQVAAVAVGAILLLVRSRASALGR